MARPLHSANMAIDRETVRKPMLKEVSHVSRFRTPSLDNCGDMGPILFSSLFYSLLWGEGRRQIREQALCARKR